MLQSAYAAALTEVLLPYIRDNFPKETIMLDQMKRNAGVTRLNDEFIAPVRTGRHPGVAALANDGNNIVSSNGATFGRGTVTRKINTGAFDISHLTMKSSEGALAVKGALQEQAETLASDFGRSLNRQVIHDGVGVVSQVLGSVSGTEASLLRPNANLDDGRSIDWYGSINGDVAPDKYLAAGQIVGIGTGGAATGTISSLTGTSIRFTGTLTTAADDSVYIGDGSGQNYGTSEIQGVRLALSSTTGTSLYASLPRTTIGWAPQFGSAAEALTLDRMEQTYINATEYARKSDKFVILVNKTLYRKYGAILTSMRRTVNEADLLGGWKGLEFAAGGNIVGVFLDFDIPDGEVMTVNMDTWTMCQVSDLDWLDGPAMSSLHRLQNTLTYQAVMVWYSNVLCLAPGANGRETRKSS